MRPAFSRYSSSVSLGLPSSFSRSYFSMPFFTALAISFLLSSMALLTADFTTKIQDDKEDNGCNEVEAQALHGSAPLQLIQQMASFQRRPDYRAQGH